MVELLAAFSVVVQDLRKIMKKRTAFAQRLVREERIRVASRREECEGKRVSESSCVSPIV
jgi:hypothetical protein